MARSRPLPRRGRGLDWRPHPADVPRTSAPAAVPRTMNELVTDATESLVVSTPSAEQDITLFANLLGEVLR